MAATANKKSSAAADRRLVDVYIDSYNKNHQNPTNKHIHLICVPLMVFGLMGLFWAIPFPYLKFLGAYNGFFNWASFLIAFSIFYYYRLSPQLSYLMLLLLFALSYGVSELDAWQKEGGPTLWIISLVILLLSLIGQVTGRGMEGNGSAFFSSIRSLLTGPIWVLHFFLKRFSIKY